MSRKPNRGTAPRKGARKRQLGRYKSSLEKYCADQLREFDIPFFYEETEFTLMDSFRHNGVYWKMTSKNKDMSDRSNKIVLPIKYTPDFIGKKHNFIIETKGYTPSHHDFPMRWKLFLKYLEEQNTPMPALFIPKNKHQVDHTIQIIKKLIEDGRI
jgi:hypothetical protein